MPRALWLPDTLRAHGLTVHETPGWQNRGSSTLNPSGVVCHHTASAAGSDHPALGTVINGRPDLNGPLCNVLLARNGDCYIIAAGTANHAGTGGWRGLSGNSSVLGIEAENNGVGEPWPAHQIDAYVRLCAAMCDGGGFTPDTVCYHREWAPTRKPDPAGPGIPSGDEWRRRVAEALTQGDAMTADDRAYVDAHDLKILIELKKTEVRLTERMKFKSRKTRAELAALKADISALEAKVG